MAQAEEFNATEGMMSDQDIVGRVLGGDIACFELVMRRYNRRLYRIARGVLRNEADAEDAVQDAYLTAYEKLGQFQGKGPLSAWLAKITINEALGRLRGTGVARESISLDDPNQKEEANFMAYLTSPAPSPEQNAARGELRRLMESAIDALPEAYRLVFILCGVEEMSVAETAYCLEVEPATVKTRYHRARNILKENLSSLVDSAAGEAFPFAGERCDRIVAGVLRRLELRNRK
jgi:RNA polymerase sigma-70 factor (ECF subfamily)